MNEIGESFCSSLTDQNKLTVRQYTRCGGVNVCDAERGKVRWNQEDLSFEINAANAPWENGVYRPFSEDYSIAAEMSDIISANSNTTPIVTYRYGKSLPPLKIDESSTLDQIKSIIGESYIDRGFQSSTAIIDSNTSYAQDGGIIEKVICDTGVGALIQPESGISPNYAEFLINRNTKNTIIDAYKDLETEKIVIVKLVSLA